MYEEQFPRQAFSSGNFFLEVVATTHYHVLWFPCPVLVLSCWNMITNQQSLLIYEYLWHFILAWPRWKPQIYRVRTLGEQQNQTIFCTIRTCTRLPVPNHCEYRQRAARGPWRATLSPSNKHQTLWPALFWKDMKYCHHDIPTTFPRNCWFNCQKN